MADVKKIPTFSWLVRKAEALMRKDRFAYAQLRRGSETFLKGCRVTLSMPENGGGMKFNLTTLKDHKDYVVITGFKDKEEFYTHYQTHFTATQYRKRMHKWLPVTLPNGASLAVDTKAIFHNADGSVAAEGKWYCTRRGREGKPSIGVMVIRDRDGALLLDGKAQEIAARSNYHQPIDLWHGMIPGSAQSKMDWYASLKPPEFDNHDLDVVNGVAVHDKVNEPLWDEKKVRLLAAKVHAGALRLAKGYPHIKIAMLSGRDWGGENDDGNANFRGSRFGARNPVVIGRHANGKPLLWMLPELIAYWIVPPEETRHQMVVEVRCIRVVIPPVGCRQLVRRNNESYVTLTYRWGPQRTINSGYAIERAYHQLECVGIGKDDDGWSGGSYRSSVVPFGQSRLDAVLHDWDVDPNVVIVHDQTDERHIYRSSCARAAKPEGVFSKIEEAELIDSLPLC